MTTKTKFEMYDKAWFYHEGKAIERSIIGITVEASIWNTGCSGHSGYNGTVSRTAHYNPEVKYFVDINDDVKNRKYFSVKEALLFKTKGRVRKNC